MCRVKILSMMFVIAMLCVIFAVPINAASAPLEYADEILLDLDVPISARFTIDSKGEFHSEVLEIFNHSPVPVTVSAVSMKAAGTSPKLISRLAYTDEMWNNLDKAKTQSTIALGLQLSDSDDLDGWTPRNERWFSADGKEVNMELGTIKPYKANTSPPRMGLVFVSEYGKAWTETQKLQYELLLSFSAVK